MGINTSVLANHSMNGPKKAYKPYDFMPSKHAEKQEEATKSKARRFTRQGLADDIRLQMKMMLATGLVVEKKATGEEPGL